MPFYLHPTVGQQQPAADGGEGAHAKDAIASVQLRGEAWPERRAPCVAAVVGDAEKDMVVADALFGGGAAP